MGGAARVGHGPYAAGPGAAAHREGQDRSVPVRSDPRCSCAADGLLQKIVTASLVEPVQVLAVPKISLDRTPQRSAVRRTQMTEQLVEVPTEPRSLVRGLNFEVFSQDRLVDIPVLRGRREERRSSRFSFKTEFSSIECDTPVPHSRGGRGGLQDFLPGQDSTAFCGADRVDNPVPCVGGLPGFLPGRVSSASSSHSPGAR